MTNGKIYWNNLAPEIEQAIKNPEVAEATNTQLGTVKIDNNTIKKNAQGQIYADVQGSGIDTVKKVNNKDPNAQGEVTLVADDLNAYDKTTVDSKVSNVQTNLDTHANNNDIHTTLADKTKLDGIAENANNYSLPIASSLTLGGVKVDNDTIVVETDGTIKAKVSTPNITGVVKKVNTKSPDEHGLVTLDANDVDAYTKLEVDTKVSNHSSLRASDVALGHVKIDNVTIKENTNGQIYVDSSTIGEGTVKKVNGKSPNTNGNVEITADDVDTYNISTLDAAFDGYNADILALQTNKFNKADIADDLNTDDAEKVLSAKQGKILNEKIINSGTFTPEDKQKLDGIDAGANKYTLPVATTTDLGGIKVDGSSIKINNGVISTEVADLSIFIKTVNGTITPVNGNVTITAGDLNAYTKAETNDAIADGIALHADDVASTTNLGHVKVDGATIIADANGTIKVAPSIPTKTPKTKKFTCTTVVDSTHKFIYKPSTPILTSDDLDVNYNTTALDEVDWDIIDIAGEKVIKLNVDQADNIQYNSISGRIFRDFDSI